ncbi:Ionotropic receptor 41a13 [Blattella germanica]|nr:Ionotropic receptor 41a13 [Blattella germanica]
MYKFIQTISLVTMAVYCSPLAIQITEELARMSLQIVTNHFNNSKCVALITEDNADIVDFLGPLHLPIVHSQIPSKILKDSKPLQTGFEQYEWDIFLVNLMDASCLAFIIQTSDISFMVKTFARLAHSPLSLQRAVRKFLYLPTQEVPDDIFESNLRELYTRREMDFMPDVVVAKLITEFDVISENDTSLYADDTDTELLKIELITHRFVGPKSSDRISLDIWSPDEGFLQHADLYPDKITNLMGKELSFTTILYPPLSAVYVDVNPPIYDGLEFQIMHAMSRRNNFTFRMAYRPEEWWGAIWENGSGTGMSGLVSMDMADIGFGAIYLWENEYRFTDYSTVYFRTSLTAVLPRPKLLPGWMVPIHPFSKSMWCAVAVSVIVCTTILYLISQGSVRLLGGTGQTVVNMYSTWLECAFRTMGLLVLQVPPDERDYSTTRYVPLRHLVTWLILLYFLVTTGYSAGLASVLTLPKYEPPIETPVEMVDRGVVWGGMDIAYVFFLQKSLDPKMRRLAASFVEATEEYLTKKAATGEMGFVIERMLNGHFFLPPYVTEKTMKKLRVMKEDYVYGHCVYMVRKGSPYKGIINQIVHKVRDTGLVLYWEDRTVRRYMSTRRQLSVINSRKDIDSGPTQLLLRHVTGSFYLLCYGLTMSLVVFILELLRYYFFPQNKNTFDVKKK